jgi:hypothetical protein
MTRSRIGRALQGAAVAAATAGVLGAGACKGPPERPRRETTAWTELAAWQGSGPVQTESFISDSGQLRLRWETKNERSPGAGRFKVVLHSAVSGRPLVEVVERQGTGRETSYVNEDPRAFFLVVEAANLDWTVAVDEGVRVTVLDSPNR